MTYTSQGAGASPIRVLFWDIETSPVICSTWSLYPESLNHSDIIEDWRIICAAWKWADSNTIESTHWAPTSDKQISPVLGKDDARVIRKLHAVLSQADVLVGHNSDNFDWKKFQTRCIELGLKPVDQKASIDTLKVARKEFKFTSNRLDYIGEYLGVGGKMDTPKGLHKAVMWSVPGALKTMLEYNKRDVELLEAVYDKLKPYIRNHPRLHFDQDKPTCVKCGNHSVVKNGMRPSHGNMIQKWVCKGCGSNLVSPLNRKAPTKAG
jgi:RNase_H superfamily